MAKMTAAAAIAKVRALCLALPDTSEGEHYGEAVFKVGKKLFASCGEKSGPCRIVVQLEPAHAAKLLANDRRYQKYPWSKDAVVIAAADVTDWDEMASFLAESHRLNAGTPRARNPGKRGANRPRQRR